jgi:hypothetical protein
MKTWLSLFTAFAVVGLGFAGAQAGTVSENDTIIGVFDTNSIVYKGCFWAGPGPTNPVCGIDNTSTAPPFIEPPPPQSNNTLRWGTMDTVPPDKNFSMVTFEGGKVPPLDQLHSDCSQTNISHCFKVGQFKFLNGESQSNSVIFGVTLNFYDNAVSPANSLGSMDVLISATVNTGTDDSDYVNICGNNSMICNATITKSLNADEATETTCSTDPTMPPGCPAGADLYGTIVGDPQLILADMVLVPGTNGFVSNDLPVAFVAPEPASWTVLIFGLGLIIVLHLAGDGLPRPNAITD